MKTKFKYEERVIQLFYHFKINNIFSKNDAYVCLKEINPKITVNAVRDTLERVIWNKRYLEEDTYNQWYWQTHYKGYMTNSRIVPDDDSMMDIFVDRDDYRGVDKRKNYYKFSHKAACNLIHDFDLEIDDEMKKQLTKCLLLNK